MLTVDFYLKMAADPATSPKRFSLSIARLAVRLLRRHVGTKGLEGRRFHVITTIADFNSLAVPIMRYLQSKGGTVAMTCAWTVPEVLVSEPLKEIAPIRTTMKAQLEAHHSYELVLATAAVGTIAELKSLVTHALYDQKDIDYHRVLVVCPYSHRDAEREFKSSLPQGYSGLVSWQCYRKESDIAPDGTLVPGIGARAFLRVGFQSIEQTFGYIPETFMRFLSPRQISNPAHRPGFSLN